MSMKSVYESDPGSVACPMLERPHLYFKHLQRWPLHQMQLDMDISELIAEKRPTRPYAFVYGHGLWNELAYNDTLSWIDQVQERVTTLRPYIGDFKRPRAKTPLWPRIFVGPNAAGENKQDGFLLTQGNKALVRFEKFMRAEVPKKGPEFLGTWNMSIQGTIPDGR